MENSKLWKYCVVYLGFAIAVALIDIWALSDACLFRLDRMGGSGIQMMANGPILAYFGVTIIIDRWLERTIKAAMVRRLTTPECPPPIFNVITCARTAAIMILVLAVVVRVENFWVGIFHIATLIDAISVALRGMVLCRSEWASE